MKGEISAYIIFTILTNLKSKCTMLEWCNKYQCLPNEYQV